MFLLFLHLQLKKNYNFCLKARLICILRWLFFFPSDLFHRLYLISLYWIFLFNSYTFPRVSQLRMYLSDSLLLPLSVASLPLPSFHKLCFQTLLHLPLTKLYTLFQTSLASCVSIAQLLKTYLPPKISLKISLLVISSKNNVIWNFKNKWDMTGKKPKQRNNVLFV